MKRFALMKFNMDGGGGGGSDSAPVTPAATPAATPTPSAVPAPGAPLVGINPLLDPNWMSGEPPAAAPVAQETPTIEQLDFAGRKVPVTDPIIKDIHKDYSHLQKTFQETNATVKTLQEQNQMYMQMIQQFQSQQQAPAAPAAPPQPQGPTAEEMESFGQQYMDKFYENPIEANKMLFESPYMKDVLSQQIEAAVNQALGPIQQREQASQQKEQFQNEVQAMSQKYPDFNSHIDAMQAVIDQNPKLAEMGLETVYMVAKGQNAQPIPTVDQLLQDPAFKQSLMGNEQIKNEFFNQIVQNKTATNLQIPPVMGNQPGGSTPTIPEQSPKSIGEASKMFSRWLNSF